MRRLGLWLGAALCLAQTALADSRDHIRVVLDLSQSMHKNDPGQMALLSTSLLYDLANPSIGEGDSFKVIPFHPHWQWAGPSLPAPTDNGSVITAESKQRQTFIDAVDKLQYQAECTYFYPGLRAAVQDLATTGKIEDSRTVVLITDGVPDNPCRPKTQAPTQDKEAELIQRELVPLLLKQKIRLYVLAFGHEALARQAFFKAMLEPVPGQPPLGDVFLQNDGESLLEGMLKLFASSLGYGVEGPQPLPQTTLKLGEGGGLPRTAVVVLSPKAAAKPSLGLTPPPSSALNIQNGYPGALRPGAAYTLAWVLNPAESAYGFTTDAKRGTVALLRPSRVLLNLRPAPPHNQAAAVMAETELPLLLEANNEFGGRPGKEVVIQYTLHAPAIDWNTADRPDAPQEDSGLAPLRSGGRVYRLSPRWPKNPQNPAERYTAHIEAQASAGKGEKILGKLHPQHEVEVYPFLSIAPSPAAENIGTALERGEKRCADFTLRLSDDSHLPALKTYPLKAALYPADPAVVGQEFHLASFELDNAPVQFAGRPIANPSSWTKGRELSRAELLEQTHTLCVRIGKPQAGDPAKPIELPLGFTLAKAPYDDFAVIKPFTLRLALATPPADHSRWPWLAGFGLLVLAALWHLRDRPVLAPDLGYAIGADTPTARLVFHTFPRGGWATWLGLRAELPIVADSGGPPLAWLRPVDGELYQVRLARGTHMAAERGSLASPGPRRLSVSVRQVYRLHSAAGTFLFRLEYR